MKVIIESSAPTRADLAGGTVDIWPLYLFHYGAMTVNFALSLRAHVRIATRDDDRLILESRDRGIRFETTLDRIDELAREESLELVSKMVHFFQPEIGFHLVAHSEAPAGAGISGSAPSISWRAIAMRSDSSSALRRTLKRPSSKCRLDCRTTIPPSMDRPPAFISIPMASIVNIWRSTRAKLSTAL